MLTRLLAAAAVLALCACQNASVKVLVGPTTVVAPGAQPIEDSVIVIADRKIRLVGFRKDIPIPQDSERTNLTGKWVVPAPGGRIALGEPATLLILDHPPRDAAPANASDVTRRLIDGNWQ